MRVTNPIIVEWVSRLLSQVRDAVRQHYAIKQLSDEYAAGLGASLQAIEAGATIGTAAITKEQLLAAATALLEISAALEANNKSALNAMLLALTANVALPEEEQPA